MLLGGHPEYFLPTPLVKERVLACNDTQRWTDEIDNTLLATYTHRLNKEDTARHAAPHSGCTWEQSEAAGAEGDGLCSNKRSRCPLVPIGGCDGLV